MWEVGLIICAVVFVGMLAIGGPHHMTSIHERFRNTVQMDDGRGQVSEGRQQAIHGGHDHAGTDTGVGDHNKDKDNREP